MSSKADPDKGRPITSMCVGEMRIAMQGTAKELEERKRRGLTVDDIGPRAFERAFEKGFHPHD